MPTKRRRESALESWACRWSRARGIPTAKLQECTGIPDRIFFVPNGAPVVGEFKALDEGLGAVQDWYYERLTAYGYAMYRFDTKEAFLKVMEKYADR